MADEFRIPIKVDAAGVGPGVDATVAGLNQVKDSTEAASAAATELGGAAATLGEAAAPIGTVAKSAEEVAREAAAAAQQARLYAAALREVANEDARNQINAYKEAIRATRAELEAAAAAAQGMAEAGTGATDQITQGAGTAEEGLTSMDDPLEDISSNLEDNRQKGESMIHELGGMRESHRLAVELFESFQDGGEKIAGVTGLLRTFLMSSELLPPFAAAIATIGLSFASVWAIHSDGSEDAKKKVKDDLAESGVDVKTFGETWKSVLADILRSQTLIEQSDARQVTAIQAKSRAEADLLEAKKKNQLEEARWEYLESLTPGMSPEDRKKSEETFKNRKAQIEADSETDAAQLALATKQAEIDQLSKNLADVKGLQKTNQVNLQQRQDDAADAQNYLANRGLSLDKDGKIVDGAGNDALAAAQKKLEHQEDEVQGDQSAQVIKENFTPNPGLSPEENEVNRQGLERRKKMAQQQLNDLEADELEVATLDTAAQKITAYQIAQVELGKAITDSIQKVSALHASINEATAELPALEMNVQTAQGAAKDTGMEQDIAKGYSAKDESDKYFDAAQEFFEKRAQKQGREEVESLTGQIEAKAINYDGSSNKGMLEALRKVVDLFKGKTDEASDAAEIAELQNILAGQFVTLQAKHTKTQHELHEVRHKVDHLLNNGQS